MRVLNWIRANVFEVTGYFLGYVGIESTNDLWDAAQADADEIRTLKKCLAEKEKTAMKAEMK